MIVFGIDPGSHKTGWGVIDIRGNQIRFIDCGVIRAKRTDSLSERIQEIYEGLVERLEKHQPERVCLESIFHHKSAKSALVLGHARGVALLAAKRHTEAELHEISPAEVKKAVTGHGRADKRQVQEMIKVLLGLPEVPAEDAADALAVAIAGSNRVRETLPAALRAGRRT